MPSAEAATAVVEAEDFGVVVAVADLGAVVAVDSAVAVEAVCFGAVAVVCFGAEAVDSEAAAEAVCFGAVVDLEAVAVDFGAAVSAVDSVADALAVSGADSEGAIGSFSGSAILPGIGPLTAGTTRTSTATPIITAIHIRTRIQTIPMVDTPTLIILIHHQRARPVPGTYRQVRRQRLQWSEPWPMPMGNGITSESAQGPEAA